MIAWMKAGPVELKPGTTTITFKMHSSVSHHGGLDCFCFTKKPFTPSGSRKPGEKLGLAEPGTWAFEPEEDEFSPAALLDLRSLNEKAAGESGFVQSTPAGDFALGNGQSVRFWSWRNDALRLAPLKIEIKAVQAHRVCLRPRPIHVRKELLVACVFGIVKG